MGEKKEERGWVREEKYIFHRIGEVVTIAGGETVEQVDGTLGVARFNIVMGLAVDPSTGTIYLTGPCTVRKICEGTPSSPSSP